MVGQTSTEDDDAITRLRLILHREFACAVVDNRLSHEPEARGWLSELVPCVAQFWKVLDKQSSGAGAGVLQATSNDAALLEALGMLLRDNGDFTGAMETHREALAFREQMLPADHPTATATSMSNLATSYYKLGRHDEALELEQGVLQRRRCLLPPEHPDIAQAMDNLALTYLTLGQHAEALVLQQGARGLRGRTGLQTSVHDLNSMNSMSMTYNALGRHNEALKLQQDALVELPQIDPLRAPLTTNLALSYSALGRHDEALELRLEVLAHRRRTLPREHPSIAVSMCNVAATYMELGRHGEALELQQEALAFEKRVLPRDHPTIAASMSNLQPGDDVQRSGSARRGPAAERGHARVRQAGA